MKPLNMILAAAENNAIGRKGGIPWHIREDFLYFKRTTLDAFDLIRELKKRIGL